MPLNQTVQKQTTLNITIYLHQWFSNEGLSIPGDGTLAKKGLCTIVQMWNQAVLAIYLCSEDQLQLMTLFSHYEKTMLFLSGITFMPYWYFKPDLSVFTKTGMFYACFYSTQHWLPQQQGLMSQIVYFIYRASYNHLIDQYQPAHTDEEMYMTMECQCRNQLLWGYASPFPAIHFWCMHHHRRTESRQ